MIAINHVCEITICFIHKDTDDQSSIIYAQQIQTSELDKSLELKSRVNDKFRLNFKISVNETSVNVPLYIFKYYCYTFIYSSLDTNFDL